MQVTEIISSPTHFCEEIEVPVLPPRFNQGSILGPKSVVAFPIHLAFLKCRDLAKASIPGKPIHANRVEHYTNAACRHLTLVEESG